MKNIRPHEYLTGVAKEGGPLKNKALCEMTIQAYVQVGAVGKRHGL